MRHIRLLPFLPILFTASHINGQHLLHNQPGNLTGGRLGALVRGAGDLDGDAVPDFLVTLPMNGTGGNNIGRVLAVSGRDWHTLYTMQQANSIGWDVAVIGDVDGDGRNDIVVAVTGSYGLVQVRSGATGALLRTHGTQQSPVASAACSVGDFDSDGRDDYALATTIAGQYFLEVMSGRTGAQLTVVLAWNGGQPYFLRNVGDQNGDGNPEVVPVIPGQPLPVISLYPPQLLRSIDHGSRNGSFAASVEVGDVNGDGRLDLAVSNENYAPAGAGGQGSVLVFSAATGVLLRTLALPDRRELRYSHLRPPLANLGDLDRDGAADFAVVDDSGDPLQPNRYVHCFAGATGSLMSTWPGSAGLSLFDSRIAGVGDLDGDGYGDLLIGMPDLGSSQQGHWQVVSGAVLATLRFLPVTCTGGPFPPQLGITRPVLGQTATIAGRDCPPGAWGALLLSQPADNPINLGAAGCDAWFELSGMLILYTPPQGGAWSVQLPLPLLPQLAGREVALQAFYAPSNGPVGFDLSNAVWARFGF